MKTHINGHALLATKYQLSNVYTKVQSHIDSVSSALSTSINNTNNTVNSLLNSLLNKYAALLEKDIKHDNDIAAALNDAKEYSDIQDLKILKDSKDFSVDKDNLVIENLTNYVNTQISNLGSVYNLIGKLENGEIASNISLLPTSAKIGDIYFVNNILSDESIETEQYICVSNEPEFSINKWQKFGSSVNLSNYLTTTLISNKIQEAIDKTEDMIDNVSSTLNINLNDNMSNLAENTLNSAKEYTNTQINTTKEYIDTISSTLSTTFNKNMSDLKLDAAALAKEYTNEAIENALFIDSKEIYIKQRALITSNNADPDYGKLSGNTTYKFLEPVSSITFKEVEDSDYETLIYFKTNDQKLIPNGMPSELLYIDNGFDMNNLPLNTSFVMTIRNSVARIEKIVSLTPENIENGEEQENTDI